MEKPTETRIFEFSWISPKKIKGRETTLLYVVRMILSFLGVTANLRFF